MTTYLYDENRAYLENRCFAAEDEVLAHFSRHQKKYCENAPSPGSTAKMMLIFGFVLSLIGLGTFAGFMLRLIGQNGSGDFEDLFLTASAFVFFAAGLAMMNAGWKRRNYSADEFHQERLQDCYSDFLSLGTIRHGTITSIEPLPGNEQKINYTFLVSHNQIRSGSYITSAPHTLNAGAGVVVLYVSTLPFSLLL